MEVRAREAMGLAQDLTPPIPPLAAALHDAFLSSHCSSCFRLIFSRNTPLNPISFPSCPSCNASILYCSQSCSASDSPRHVSSGECRLLSTSPHACTSDLRAALRLLHSLGSHPLPTPPSRIGGLLVCDLDGAPEEEGESEISGRIREGATLMARARNGKLEGDVVATAEKEKAALWAVVRNAVEVQVGGAAAVGIAVYGPMFSWLNHSCSPNACYRFEYPSRSELDPGSFEPSSLRVFPSGHEQDAAAWSAWFCSETQLFIGLCGYGPRVVVRATKPIKKGEEICIAYIDLLQPKAARRADLSSKYRFLCCCARCSASPQQYVDHVLSCDLRILNSDHANADTSCEELADFLDQAIDKYMDDGNPQFFCEMVENMLLSGSFASKQFQAEKPFENKFKLHPLHHLSLSAYMSLSSTYKVRANDFGEENATKNFKMSRAATAYALLLAGATNHLFLSDVALIANGALFWINAGEALLNLLRSSKWDSAKLVDDESGYSIDVIPSHWSREIGPSVSWNEFEGRSVMFLNCISGTLIRFWPFLTEGFSFLEKIESPVDFTWLGLPKFPHQTLVNREVDAISREHLHFESQFKPGTATFEQERMNLFQVAALCLHYGRYLASICYGPKCYLADNASHLLNAQGFM
ncbi:hypothetical protein J5N97_012337 [Dioscorea zingiberensis]|uniref:SET domain-containing protein n=1 Tax=Dioscorea zingiberensis TaxID=325984 RepID=A0A9D5HHQ8_9LILI|nr:hypothetical protein J5N97_012337 [Dioscorea zingiberensis]